MYDGGRGLGGKQQVGGRMGIGRDEVKRRERGVCMCRTKAATGHVLSPPPPETRTTSLLIKAMTSLSVNQGRLCGLATTACLPRGCEISSTHLHIRIKPSRTSFLVVHGGTCTCID